MKKLLTLIFVFAVFSIPSANAESAYSWEDATGTINFGNNPPKEAKNVKKLKSKTLSRYSTKKVFKGYGIPYNLQSNLESDSFAIETGAPNLEKGELVIKHDADNRLTICSLLVTNKGQKTADNVLVSFEFPDGTVIPALGPTELKPESGAVYELPNDLLPLKVASGVAKPTPIVILK